MHQTGTKWLPDSFHNQDFLTIYTVKLAVYTTQNIHMLQNQYTKGKQRTVSITNINVTS